MNELDWIMAICPPRLPRFRVARPNLTELFAELSAYQLIEIVTPAGFAKTVSVRLWLNQQTKQSVWFNVPAINFDISMLKRWLFENKHQPFLVLDDAHNLCENGRLLLSTFIHSLADHQQLYVLSRTPVLNLSASLKAEGRLASIGLQELMFSRSECRQLLRNWKLDEDVIKLIPDYVCGWPAAIQLWASAALRYKTGIVEHPQWQIELNSYMKLEWLSLMSDSQRDTLIYMALSEGTPIGILRNAEYLSAFSEFISQGIIQISSDQSSPYCLAGILRQAIKSLPSEFLIEYHLSLGLLLLKTAQYASALHHFVLAKNSAHCMEVIKLNAWLLFQQGRMNLLASAFEIIDKEQLLDNPSLCFLRAELLLHRDQAKSADRWINYCEQHWFSIKQLDEKKLLGINAYKTTIAVVFEDYAAALHWGQSAMLNYKGHLQWEYGKALVSLAEASFYQGDLIQAERYARLADSVSVSNHLLPILASARYWIGQVLWHKGEYFDALGLLQYTVQELESNNRLDEWRLDFICLLLTSFSRQIGMKVETEQLFHCYGLPEIEHGGFWALPWLTEKLSLCLTEPDKTVEEIQSLVNAIEASLAKYRVSLVWRLNAEQACILAWAFLNERRKLKLRVSRTLWNEDASFLLYSQERFSQALAWLALAEPERAAAIFEECRRKSLKKHVCFYHQLSESSLMEYKEVHDNEVVGYWQGLIASCLPAELNSSLDNKADCSAPQDEQQNIGNLLTPTEKKVFLRFTEQGSNEEIAHDLGMAVSTLRSHIKALNKKLGCKKRSELRDFTMKCAKSTLNL